MWLAFLADLLLVVHFGFVLLVIFGSLLVLRWQKLVYAHMPALLWGILIELNGWICPLTPLEQNVRQLAAGDTYDETFIQHYIMPVLYPLGLTKETMFILGIALALFNAVVYIFIFFRWRKKTG